MAINQLKSGAVLNYVILGLNALVGIAYTPYMLRMLGQSEYGIYSLAASVISYLSILDFGFGNAVIRYTAKYRAEGDEDRLHSMFGLFTILYSVIGVVAFCVGLILYYHVESLFGETLTLYEIEQTKAVILLMVLNLALTFPLSIYGAIITAYENFVFLRVVQIARILLNTLVMVCLLSVGYKSVAMVVVQSVFNILALLLNYFYCRRKIRIKIHFAKMNWRFLREISVYSFWVFLNIILDKIYWSTGQFILGTTSGAVAVAIFSVAVQLRWMYLMFSIGISGVFLPRVTTMVVKNNDSGAISDLFIKTGRLQYIILSLILSGFIVFGHKFILFWAGDNYGESYVIALLFLIAMTPPLIQSLGMTILQARNQMKFRSVSNTIIALGCFFMQIPLAKYFGGVGCAVPIAFGILLGQGLLINIYYQRVQKLDIKRFWQEIIRMSAVPAIMVVITIFVLFYVEIDSVLLLVAGILVFSVVYLTLFWRFSMNTYERNLFKAPVLKIIGFICR